jgi:hypothetical protein
MPSKLHSDAEAHPTERALVPVQWWADQVAAWQKLLGVDNYDIDVVVKPGMKGSEGNCERFANSLRAVLTFRQDAMKGDEKATVIHEVVHILVGPLEDAMGDVLSRYVAKACREEARQRIKQAEEHVVESIAHALVRVKEQA